MKKWQNTIGSLQVLLWTTILIQPNFVRATPAYVTEFGNAQLSNPTGLALDATGNVYVVDTGNNRVQVFGPSANNFPVGITFGNPGNGNGEFNDPIGAAISSAGPNAGNIYVTDSLNSRVQVFAPNGIYLSQFPLVGPQGIAIDSTGNSYVASPSQTSIFVFDPLNFPNGAIAPSAADPQFQFPRGVTRQDANGNLYVADSISHGVFAFDAANNFLPPLIGQGQLNGPVGVAINPAGSGMGNIYTVDTGNNLVRVFDPGGALIDTFGNGQLNNPQYIALQSSTGLIYVSNAGNNRIQVFLDPTVSTGGNVTIPSLTVNQPLPINFSLTVTGNTTLNAGGDLIINPGGSVTLGTLTLTEGVITANVNTMVGAPAALTAGTFSSTVGNTFTYAGAISDNGGPGVLTKTGAGIVALTAANTYTGGTFLNGGTTSISADANLGGAAGPLTFNSGTLATTASLASARPITLNATGGTVQVNAGTTTTLSGVIGGIGALTKTGDGTLIPTAANTYTGGTIIAAGTLIGNTTSLIGNILNNAALIFNQMTNGIFTGDIAGTGTMTKTGPGLVTMTGNFNNLTGITTIAQGGLIFTTSAPPLINLASSSSSLGFQPAANAIITYTGSISGSGTVFFNGLGTVSFTGNNKTYTGNTTVLQGIFSLNGTLLNSAVFTNAGTTITGNASIKSLDLAGTISPGTSTPIGTFTITDSFIMRPTSTYLAHISANGKSDVLAVGGEAQLNGTLNVVSDGSSRQDLKNKTYTILTINQGVSGQFANAISTDRIKYTVDYLTNSVKVVIKDLQDFADAFNARDDSNAARTARYLDTFVDNAPVGSDLATVTSVLDGFLDARNASGLKNALNQIQPSFFREFGFLSLGQATLMNKSVRMQQQYRREGVWAQSLEGICPIRMAAFQNLVNHQPMKGFFAKTMASNMTGKPMKKGLGFIQDEGVARGTPVAQRMRNELTSVWIEPFAQVNEKVHSSHGGAGNGNVGIKSRTGGFALGGDIQLCKNAFVGILGGFSNTPFDWKMHRGTGHMNTYNLGAYGTWMDGGFYIDGQIIGGQNRFKSFRNIAFGSIKRTAREHHRAFQLSTDGEIGYAVALEAITFQPFFNLDYILVHERSYKERGAESLNLAIKSKTAHFLQGELGATFYHTYVVCDTLVRPAFQLGWVQKRPVSNGKARGGLTNQPQTLIVLGDSRVRNQLAPALSLTAQFPRGLNVTANVSAEVLGGQNTGEALLKMGYDF